MSRTSKMNEEAQLNKKGMTRDGSGQLKEEKTQGPHRWVQATSNEP